MQPVESFSMMNCLETCTGKSYKSVTLCPLPPLVRQAVNRYQWLAALLKGEQPGGLLPPAPRGYVASRLQQLAGALQALLAALPTMRQGHELLQSPSNPAYSLFANLAR